MDSFWISIELLDIRALRAFWFLFWNFLDLDLYIFFFSG